MLRRTITAVSVLALAVSSATVATVAGTIATTTSAAARTVEEDSYYPSKGDPRIDVRSYALDLSWRAADLTLSGTATLRVDAVEDAGSILLDLHKAMKVRSVSVGGVRVGYDHTGKDLSISMAATAGASYDIKVRYAGRPRTVDAPTSRLDSTGLGWNTTADGQVWTMQKPYGAYTWYPVNDVPSDKARYTVDLDVPEDWVGVSNGRLSDKDTRKGRTTTRFVNAAPMASHLLTVAIGPYQKHKQTGPHGLPLTYWVPKGAKELLKPLRRTPDALVWLEKRLGRYPFDRAGVIVTPGRSSVETQTLTTLARDNYRYGASDVREQVAHALVHQWYGASVTPGDWRDLWMSEGMATYLQAKFAVSRGWDTWKYWKREFTRNDQFWRDIYGPPGAYFANEFGQRNVHYGTALMLKRLKVRIGNKRFLTLMKAWPRQNAGSVRGRGNYISFVEARTHPLGAFWEEWLTSPDSPA
ncbi:MAG: M1 family metallopeptidase [Nocardioidaceae bacterium]|nr:M1 family metallopeptidase [Nocardioidaceae bacterium]